MPYELYVLLYLGPFRSTKDIFTTADMGIVSIAGIAEDVLIKVEVWMILATNPQRKDGLILGLRPFYRRQAFASERNSELTSLRRLGRTLIITPQVLLGRPTLKTAGFNLDYITDTFSFKFGNVEEVFHPKRPPALNKKFTHQVQLSKEDKVEEEKSEEAKEKLKKGKGLRHSPPHMKMKKKDSMKKKVKKRNQGKENSKEQKKEKKEKKSLEFKCKSMEDLIGKLYTFKKVLHHNDAMNHHLVKDQSKWK
ncbi:hypothetical protein PIB30_088083 [Stylosanthes scabra]|uniref:Uncharacterized protein n=1 Tax=Stylosanthes scabra TaxID=79078 RepID=A0ABU6QT48_9FABA|nr:hypothetical protein [Stylosanthes scabra]